MRVRSHDYFGSDLSTDLNYAPLFQHSRQSAEDSFTLLDGTHIVHMCRTDRHLLVENFGAQNEEERSLGLSLEIPPHYKASAISASSIPSPPSQHPQPFWTDPALRVVVVRMSTEDAALLIPYKTFREALSLAAAVKRNRTTDRMSPGYSMAWEQWSRRGVLLVRIPETESIWLQWNFQLCQAYGSRVPVQGSDWPVTIFDLNPWAERNARRYPPPAHNRWWFPGDTKDFDSKRFFGTKDAALPHAALTMCHACYGLGQGPCGLAADPMGFSEVVSDQRGVLSCLSLMRCPLQYSQDIWLQRYLGSISHYVRQEPPSSHS